MNCTTCMIGDFKSELCPVEFCKQCGKEGGSEDVEKMLMNYKLKWIPCEERLPSGDGQVLVNVCVNDAPWSIILMSSDSVKEYYKRGHINAWMPLPEPYKENK